MGVRLVVVDGVVYGRGPKSEPVSADTPTTFFCVKVRASYAVITSSFSCRVKTNTRLPTTIGVAYPVPTATCHCFFNAVGHEAGARNDGTTPSRFGPRH